ncbi:N-acetylglucosamine-6-sulfatase-like [Eupeodes corollae]|uniref:N-acetylglucosamine-6-sulfatase-like n=1 Tax=Eupeodes corollae TaxID=290404 RepID=UPI00249095FC|nr:N-acetylglucosamine-6-sulfatase-like [Eupeodes corollae]
MNCVVFSVVLSLLMVVLEVSYVSTSGFLWNQPKPNILLILTDDQDIVLHGLTPMHNVQQLIGSNGATFSNAFTSSPICCPSRASILSGMYAHNHRTLNNSVSGGCYGSYWRKKVEPKVLPVVMQQSGYDTFFAGKYLNDFSGRHVPPGWKEFYGLQGNSRYYNYSLNENGRINSYTDRYLTDLLAEKSVSFFEERKVGMRPFFAMIAPPAPHAPFTPAPRHRNAFAGLKAPRTSNFNVLSGNLDKHWLVAFGEKMSTRLISNLDIFFQKRWESLLAVDEMVGSIISSLNQTGELDNTYIVFTSDNGYHLGQFAQPFDKRQPYETDIRVPFLVRGPNIPKKSIISAPISLIDLVPTIYEWAGIIPRGNEDGISFQAYLMNPKYNPLLDRGFHREILVQYWGEGNSQTYNFQCPWKKSDNLAECTMDADCHCQDSWNNTYACIRHFRFGTNKLYCEFQDHEQFVESYDLDEDPYQMDNLGYEMLPIERALYSLALHNLTTCIGSSCRIVNL